MTDIKLRFTQCYKLVRQISYKFAIIIAEVAAMLIFVMLMIACIVGLLPIWIILFIISLCSNNFRNRLQALYQYLVSDSSYD